MRNEAQLCPICMGKGTIQNRMVDATDTTDRCHGCDGKGWVVVEQPGPMDGVRLVINSPIDTGRVEA